MLENSFLGSTGYQPVPSGDSPDGGPVTFPTNDDTGLILAAPPIAFGGSPTGSSESLVLPVSQLSTGNK
ncbi:MAG: hypothetical protein HY735_08995 [Verrucomicrobia bacterium]|nr:hypothetical protein [Verrucomicrobiota bacterium]